MKKLLAAVTFMAIMAAGAAFAAPEYTIKVGYIGSDTHPTMQAMKVFAKDVDAGSKGKIKVELYPNAQLGGYDPDGYPLDVGPCGIRQENTGPRPSLSLHHEKGGL